MLKPSLAAVAVLMTAGVANAQVPPTAGTQLQQLPQPPAQAKPTPSLEIDRPPTSTDTSGGAAIVVRSLRVTGQSLFPEADLIAATGYIPGSSQTLGQLRQLAVRISDYYHARGYFLAQAYLPEQDVQGGTITIAVVEGRYGKIDLNNDTRLTPRLPTALLSSLEPGDIVANAPLERRLLLLSDIPGVRVKGTLAPGGAVGTSDLRVDLTRGAMISGTVEADNAGSRYTGAYRFGGTINVNNPAGVGDLLSLRLLGSDGGLGYGRISYQAPLGGVTFGIAYAHLRYALGREFALLDGSGTADIISAYASYPLIRSRRANLYALGNVDYRFLTDRIGVVSSTSDKRITAGTLGLSGDFRDDIAGGSANTFSLGWTIGRLDIRNAAERAIDSATARRDGGYSKLQGSFSRSQTIAGPLSLFGAVRGQIAFANLDSSEQFQLGGAYGVRAYPEGEAFGDWGYLATAEARLRLGQPTGKLPGIFELIGFIDTGEVRFAQDPWFAGPNRAVRSGYGAGANWYGPQGIILRGSYARKLGTGPATSAPDRDGRFWFQVVKLF